MKKGSVLENDFCTPSPPFYLVHDRLFFSKIFNFYFFKVRYKINNILIWLEIIEIKDISWPQRSASI